MQYEKLEEPKQSFNGKIMDRFLLMCIVISFCSCSMSPKGIGELDFDLDACNLDSLKIYERHFDTLVTNIRHTDFEVIPEKKYKLWYWDCRLVGLSEVNDEQVGNGLYLEFYENGSIYIRGNLLNGVSEGIWESYSMDGILITKDVFQNGILKTTWSHPQLDSIVATSFAH